MKRSNVQSAHQRSPVIHGALFILLIAVLMLFSVNCPADTDYPPQLPTGYNCDFDGTSPYRTVGGVGDAGQGAGVAIGDINRNGKKDIVLMAYDNPGGENTFRYRIGWDINLSNGEPTSWKTGYTTVAGVGVEGQGAGIELADIDGNGILDMILMAYDNSPGANTFRYKVGWNISTNGVAASWSNKIEVSGVGYESDGAGLAVADIDQNGQMDLVLMAEDNPAGNNSYRYRIGWNLNSSGIASSWTSNYFTVPSMGDNSQGADIIIADIDLDDELDLVIMTYDEGRNQWNNIRYRVGWRMDADGSVKDWSRWFFLRGMGKVGAGAGLDYFMNTTGSYDKPTLCFMVYDDQSGPNNFRYFMRPVTTSGTCYGYADHNPPTPNNNLIVPGSPLGPPGSFVLNTRYGFNLFNLNMSLVQQTAEDALAYFVFSCFFSALIGENPEACWYNWPDDDVNWASIYGHQNFSTEMCPDLLVAAVALYVDAHMGYVTDDVNSYVLNTIFNLNYPHGAEAVPAYYVINYTNPSRQPNLISDLTAHNASWGQEYNDGNLFHGDCEDYAILRHALLRALGFNSEFIWTAGAPLHAFNIVLYKGTYRVMDYGRIENYLCRPSGITIGMGAAWNESNGPYFSSRSRQWYKDLVERRIWPDRCGAAGAGWSFTRIHRPDFENNSKCNCP